MYRTLLPWLVADAKTLRGDGINTVAIMPNDYQKLAADSPQQMQKFALQHGFDFPYPIDADQGVARLWRGLYTRFLLA